MVGWVHTFGLFTLQHLEVILLFEAFAKAISLSYSGRALALLISVHFLEEKLSQSELLCLVFLVFLFLCGRSL